MVRTKAFIITMVLMPVFMCGTVLINSLLEGRVDIDDRKIIVLDHTGVLFDGLAKAADERNRTAIFDPQTQKQIEARVILEAGPPGEVDDAMRLSLSDQVRHNQALAFLEISGDILDQSGGVPSAVRFHTQSVGSGEVRRWIEQALSRVVQARRLESARLDARLVAWAVGPVAVDSMGLYKATDAGEIKPAERTNRELAFLVPMGILMLMWASIMLAAQPMLQSVIEEKQQRIAEVLLGSASPFDIMTGKLVGNVGVSLTIVCVYMVGGFALANYYGHADMLPLRLVGWFLIYEVLAVLLFGSLFIAVGAACSELREAQSYLMPVMMLLILPLMVWPQVMRDPMSRFASMVSLFPPATPMLMVLRLSVSSAVPFWQPLLGVVLVLAAALVAVFCAGRIFRIGILSQGKSPKLGTLLGWMIRG